MGLQESLEAGKFVVTVEIGTVVGTDITEIKENGEALLGRIDGGNVTDQQSAVLHLGSLVTCHLLKQMGHEPIFQVTCRDRNRLALQSDLLSAYVLGIRNILCLTGDYFNLGDHPEAKPVFDLDSVQLLQAIGRLNEGYALSGTELNAKTDLFGGAVVNPGADTKAAFELQIIKMEQKIEAGAKFFQTQAIYEPDVFAKFMDRAKQFNVPILAGIIPLKSAGMAKYMNKNVSGVFVPEDLINKMKEAEDKVQTSVEIAADIMKGLKDMCQGVHLMPIGWEKHVPAMLDAAGF
ncbi:MAG TPA: 5,10-methylenetetrahydrofolate reductase [Dehalococcoidia bacterium]|jgi:5,10-methylenetetrahydrofolate reductase|nr:5,10-methylenetetrahydrofolate reductase [Dehalococcoidia bacterium]